MKKRIFAALLALMLVVSLAPAAVFADEASGETDDPAGEIVEAQEEDEPEASGETEADPAEEEDPAEESGDQEETANDPASGEAEAASLETEETETLVLGSAALTATETALTSDSGELSTGSYYLSDDLTLTKDITIPSGETVTIDLRGHTLTGTGTRAVIIVNGTLTLTDSSATETSDGTGVVTGGKASSGGGVRVVNGTFTMTGGMISGNSATGNGGGGVYVSGSGTFTMTGGTISGNEAPYGGGVYVINDKASFTMTGGTISDNEATKNGGGVYVADSKATFTMSGGTISDNEAATSGGGIYVASSGTFTVSGGTISGNTANYGGGVLVASGSTLEMSSGTISGNTATTGGGGGVRVNGTFTMTGGTITKNEATKNGGGVMVAEGGKFTMSSGEISANTAANGGGVLAEGTFTMSGGAISGNTANYAGGVRVDGTFTMSGGTISGNEATSGGGGGVRVNGTFTMSGGTISGNKAATNGGGVYVDGGTSSTFTVSGVSAVTGNTLSGVTTASNVYLPSGKYITLGELDESASIGVTAEAALSEGESVEITASENDNTAYYLTAADCFSSDNESYVVRTYTSASSSGNYLVLYYPITLTTSMLTVDAKEETYTGSEIEKDITSTLTLNTDYTVSYAYNIDAGEATITITGKGNYTGTLTYEFTINPATVTPSISGATTKIYDGTTTVTDDQNLTITLTGVVEGEDVTASAASYVYDSADAGEDILITASGITLGGEDKANYTLGNTTATANVGTIAQATPTLTLSDVTATKTYDGEAVSDPKVTVTLVNGEEYTGTPTITYYDASGTALTAAPSDVGSYKVVVTVSDAGANYETVSSALDFEIIEADMTAEITGFNVPYDGQAHEVTVTAEDGATVTVTYTDADGNTVTAPTEAGAYTAHVAVTKTGYTTIEQDVTVTITVSSQAISYETAKVTKTATDGTFTNPLTQTTVFGKITYTSSNTDVATVDESGQVTIIGVGTATITASVSGADSYTAAAASYTLTVNAVTAPTETGEQILVASLTEVPEGLQSLYSTVEELQADLFARVSITSSAYTEDNVVYYDVKLQLWNGTTGQWEDATEEDFPAEGITVTLPYPDRTDSSYDFVVVHMFTETSTRLGITAGETETPAVTKTDDGLTVTLKGLSPVAVAWKEADTAATVTVTPAATATAPSTGDASTPLLWLALLTLCGAGLGLVAGKRKRTR